MLFSGVELQVEKAARNSISELEGIKLTFFRPHTHTLDEI